MKDKRSAVRPVLSLFILIAILGAALAESSPALAQDGAPEFSPTPTLTATPTPTPADKSAAAQGETDPGDTLTAQPETTTPEPTADTSADTPDNIPTQPTDLTGTPEEATVEALEAAPTATQDAEIVPLVMPEDTSNIVPGEYIVVYKKNKGDSKTLKAGRDKVREKGGQIRASYSAALKGFSAKLTAEALHELRQDSDIAFIEPDQYIYAVDGDIAEQSTPQILPSGVSGYWGLDRIDQATANRDYRYYYPSSAGTGVHVYVLDSGILTSHEQFEGRASNDYDLINDGRSESEYYFHGTAVASIVGGKDYGVAKNVYLRSVRVLDYQGKGTFSKVVEGLDWVIAHHTSPAVVNMSLGGSSVNSALNNAVASTVNAGITVVVSSGNRLGTNDSWDACNWSPASAPLAITVGATTSSDSRDTSYSTYGTCLDLFAPGTSILSATNTGDTAYVYSTGTSMAAPMVAGAAALYLADHTSAAPAEVTSAILGVATSGVLSNIGSGSPNLLLFVYGQVVLVSPANEALINQSAPTLSWRIGYSGDVYTLEVDDSSAFNSLYYTTETENASAVVAGLTEGTWYWRVRAYNPASGTTEWSETFSFSVDLTPPDAPLLSSPADNTYSVGTPAFAWSAVNTAAYYQFQYNTSSDPEIGLVHQSALLTNRSYTPPTMTREVQYYWFARARDAAGNWSAWSSPFRIMSVPAGPAAPTLSSPSNGAYLNDKTPEFTWVANTNPEVTYHIQISTNSGFSSILQEANDLPTAAYTAASLDDGKYYWRVRGKSQYGIYGGWSSIRYFTIDTERPEAPDLVSPVSGARTVGEPIFAWSAVSGATAYQLALSLSDNLKDTESNEYIYISDVISVTSHTPSIKNKNATYYWNVRARDAAGNWSFWSNSNFLTIVADTPAQASLVDPVSGKLTNDNTPTLSWKLLANSEYYHLQVAANSTFSAPLILDEDGLTGTSYTVEAADDLDDGTYYWRVRGRNNSSDYGAWSSARYFKVDTGAPDAPQAVYPLNDAAVIGTPTFKWSRPASARYYQLRYADADAPETILYTSGEITSSYLKPPAMDVMNTYVWSVRAIDAAGNPSDWSTPVSVTILPPAPGRPALSAPASASVINPDLTTLELTWSSAAYAHRYHVQVSTRTSFTAPYLQKDETAWDGLSYIPEDLLEGTYYWRVRAINENGTAGSWSGVRYFRVDQTAPNVPVLYSPKSNTQVTGTPTFQWLRAGDALTFEFAYNTSDDPETALYNSGMISRTAIKPPAMETGTLYYWFVRAYDKAGNQSEWSAANTVTILAPKPASPSLSLPATASILADTTPELSWSAVDYGESYDVQLSTSPSFSPLTREATDLDVLSYTPDVLPEARYYWRVRAKNENGTAGAWSSTRYFTVDTTAPAAPVLRSPTDGASVSGWPTVSWYAASGARYYRLAYNTVDDPETAVYTSDWITATSLKLTNMDTHQQYYWFVQAKDLGGNESDWSAARRVTVLPSKPLRVTLAAPASGTATDDATLELSWGAVSFGNTYEVQVDDSSYFSSVDYSYTSEEEATSLTTGELAPGKWYWRTRACNVDDICGTWSYSRSLIIYGKFDTEFGTDGDSQGWTNASGAAWAAASGVLSTDGLTGGHSSSAAYNDMIFTDFTYEALMKMDAPAGGEANSYGLVLRGTPSYDAWNDWTRGVYFTIRQVNNGTTQYACALAYRIVSGAWSYLGGSCGEALYGDWNSLKVYAKGTAWKFYVNDYLILNTSVSSITSGRLGVVSWGQGAAGTEVEAASAGAPIVPTGLTLSLSAQTAPAVNVDPEQVFEEMRK